MSPVDRLIEQHVLEAELRQRHIDEAMAAPEPAAPATGAPQAQAPDRSPAAHGAHPPARLVADHQPHLRQPRVVGHRRRVPGAGERQRRGRVGGRPGDALEHDPRVRELVDVQALRHAALHPHDLVHVGEHGARRVQRQVPAELARAGAEPAALQEPRRVDRARRDDDRVRPHGEPAPSGEPRAHLVRVSRPHHDAPHVRVGEHARPGRPGAGEVCDPGVLLGGGGAPEDAHPRADAALGVAAQVAVGPAQPLGAATGHRGVGPGELGRDLGDGERVLHPLEDGPQALLVELEAELRAPAVQHLGWRPEARAGVHEGRAAQPPPEREDDGRVAEGDSLPAVPVEPGQHLRWAGGEAVGGVLGPLFEHDDVRAALGQLRRRDRAAGAGADDADVGAQVHRLAHGRPSARRSSRPRATTAAGSQPRVWATAGSS